MNTCYVFLKFNLNLLGHPVYLWPQSSIIPFCKIILLFCESHDWRVDNGAFRIIRHMYLDQFRCSDIFKVALEYRSTTVTCVPDTCILWCTLLRVLIYARGLAWGLVETFAPRLSTPLFHRGFHPAFFETPMPLTDVFISLFFSRNRWKSASNRAQYSKR